MNQSKQVQFLTAESVRAGHPDKFCDQIADRILDMYLTRNPKAHVAVEVMATQGKVLVSGEATKVSPRLIEKAVKCVIKRVGYGPEEFGLPEGVCMDCEFRIHEQSSDIAQAVKGKEELGAGDQGIVIGYATDETTQFLPLPLVLSHAICRSLDEIQENVPWMKPDGKAQVTVRYVGDEPTFVDTVVVSVQHDESVPQEQIQEFVENKVVRKVIPEHCLLSLTKILVNPSGRFVKGGPAADTGLTGRKLAVDQYGPFARCGGGALSGKDPTKVDRSGAYAARWIAKNIVATGLAKRCEVQIAYAIGVAKPVQVSVDTFGTGRVNDRLVADAVEKVFDLRPAAMIDALELRRPIYQSLAVYGHFGRKELDLPWERLNRRKELLDAVIAMNEAES